VAFIRERLVDLDDDEVPGSPTDAESQCGISPNPKYDRNNFSRHEAPDTELDEFSEHRDDTNITDSTERSNGRGYRLDEIPLLDVDLGMGDYLHINRK
jgi:hypothetical protein